MVGRLYVRLYNQNSATLLFLSIVHIHNVNAGKLMFLYSHFNISFIVHYFTMQIT